MARHPHKRSLEKRNRSPIDTSRFPGSSRRVGTAQSPVRSFADLVLRCVKLSDLRHHASMGDRYRTPDGWAVEVVGLSATPDRNDGECLKVTCYGFFVALVRTVAELEQWSALSDLEPETLIPRRWSGPACPGRGKRSRARSRPGLGTGDRLTDRRGRSRPANGRVERGYRCNETGVSDRLPCVNSGVLSCRREQR